MSYFVWNKIDHAVVRGNDRKEKDYGTLVRSLTVRAQPAPLSVSHAVTFRSRKAAFVEAIASLPESKAT